MLPSQLNVNYGSHTQLVGLLDGVLARRKAATYTEQQKLEETQTDINASSGIRSHDLRVYVFIIIGGVGLSP
jgi:hypothetical protein